ncbi:phosphoribosylamine--glycine ligase [Halobacterium jilantaiense]|uniref:Phosphoribosylamine--glycine ligase n=1 Tax=Halobacterium jilantaiense TaxID=355548 RepID=A0A1I0MLA1_9EURY|nr:phosphoribosylamine--glycine ligase [Halobacterium jilantaiense]SEV88671.1 phosphoribosylamine--glycine ligase [Halobacterium jilantaiense]
MTERVLLLGGGGREHAVAEALASDCELYAAAGNRNPGVAGLADGFTELDTTDPDAVLDHAESVDATLVVVGPESPLAAGVVDALEDAGIYAFGPKQADARIETDKPFQRQFMADNDVPGQAEFAAFDDSAAAADYVESVDGHVAVKPAGLTGGKGVRVTGDQVSKAEAAEYVRESGHDEWVIEERLEGVEVTVQALVANGDVRVTPVAHDHGRAFEGDEGPNTGGMGSVAGPGKLLPFVTEDDYAAAVDTIEAVVEGLDDYRGVLYGQFMLTADGPKVVEFNARFGDPEAMNTLPAMETPLLEVLVAARDGEPLPDLSFSETATVCKYVVPEDYPTDPEGGTKLTVDPEDLRDARLYYASVDERADGVYTTTSRSYAVVGTGDSLAAANDAADAALGDLPEGLRARRDVGSEALLQAREATMADLRGD